MLEGGIHLGKFPSRYFVYAEVVCFFPIVAIILYFKIELV